MINTTSLAEQTYKPIQKKKCLSMLKCLSTNKHVPMFSDWASENRYIPPGISEYYGMFDKDTAPHMNEILDRLHPDDPCRYISLMKSVQSTGTVTVAENAIGAYIRYKLGSVFFLTSTKAVSKIRSSSAIDVLIDNSNLAHLVKPISQRMKRKTSDTAFYKEFSGGIKLLMSSYNSIGDLKSNTFHLVIRDEWDEARAELKDQGDIAGIIEGRTMGVRNFKILDISTPSRMETSRIYKSFMDGDQRYFYCPCPICGQMQVLILKGSQFDYGLTFTREKDKETGHKILIPETVRYICKFCKKDFRESKKQDMLKKGEWIPSAIPVDRKKTSYHVSGLLAPEMFLSWERICQQYINTEFGEDLLKFKDFTINYLGNPWARISKQTEWSDLKNRAEDYCYSEVPTGELKKIGETEIYEGALLLYGGVDVQKDRLELHVVGFGVGMEKWSIDYKIFYGNPGNLDDACWVALDEHVYSKTYNICGKENFISMCAIDSGYDPGRDRRVKDWVGKNTVVYEFVSDRPDRFIAVMGIEGEKALGIIKEAKVSESNLKKRYNVATSLVKEIIINNINKLGGPGAIHFPRYTRIAGKKIKLTDDHYKQFLSERYQELSPKKFGWKKIYKRNEVFDTFIYAMAAAYYQNIDSWTAERWTLYHYEILEAS